MDARMAHEQAHNLCKNMWNEKIEKLPTDEASVDSTAFLFTRAGSDDSTRPQLGESERKVRETAPSAGRAIDFSGFVFPGRVCFDLAVFDGWVWFRGATFRGEASFRGARFEDWAGFQETTFENAVCFKEATFFRSCRVRKG